jgi:hypothetical protein
MAMPVTEVRFFDTWEMLVEWGIWSTRQNGMPRYISPAQLMVVHNVQQNHRSLKITDEQAMAVDAALAQLRQRDAEMWRCGVLYFIPPTLTYAQIAQEITACGRKMNRERVQVLIQALVAWVDASLMRGDIQSSAANAPVKVSAC